MTHRIRLVVAVAIEVPAGNNLFAYEGDVQTACRKLPGYKGAAMESASWRDDPDGKDWFSRIVIKGGDE